MRRLEIKLVTNNFALETRMFHHFHLHSEVLKFIQSGVQLQIGAMIVNLSYTGSRIVSMILIQRNLLVVTVFVVSGNRISLLPWGRGHVTR